MKKFVLLILIFYKFNILAQNYSEIDAFAKTVKYIENYTVGHLAHDLTDKFEKEEDKVRAIFYWITENIEYAVDYSHNKNNIETLTRKKGVCSDYSDLFKELCDSSGIKSWKLSGYAKTRISEVGMPFFANHAWNAVEINNKKYLLDVTWAAGAVGWGKFTKRRNERYFLCPPDIFIYNHYPENEEWQLLSPVVDEQTFIDYPIIKRGFLDYNVTDLKPMNGNITDTVLNVSFISEKEISSISVAKYNWGTCGRTELKKIEFTKNNNLYSFKYKIKAKSACQLNFFIDHSPFVSYKMVTNDYRFKLPIKINLKDKNSTVKYCLSSFKYNDLAKFNRTVFSKKKFRSFNEIENANELLTILSKWNGDYSGRLLNLMSFEYPNRVNYLVYRINSEYALKLKQVGERWYFHSILKGDYH
ncbi:MAG: hypothetical protein K8R54_12130 [Bacteroidales bacterium]|nr:hypothetical protein [Bacteroidales bacterium]